MGSVSSANDLQITIEDYPGIIGNASGLDMTSATNNINNTNQVKWVNSSKGSQLQFNTQDPGVSSILAVQTVNGVVTDSAGSQISDAVVAAENVNNLITKDEVVLGDFDMGEILLTSWTPPGGTTPPEPLYNNPSGTDDDLWSFYVYSYSGLPRNRLNVLMRDLGGKFLDFILTTDLKVGGSSRQQTLAYTQIAYLSDLYRRSKSFKIDNPGVPSLQDPLVTPVGDSMDFGSLDLVIDGDTDTVYEVNSNEITVGTKGVPQIILVNSSDSSVGVEEGQSITILVPEFIEDGDLLVLIVASSESGSSQYVTPSGWTEILGELQVGGSPASTPGMNIYTRTASSEPNSYEISTSTSFNTGHVAQMHAYRNIDPSANLDVSIQTSVGSSGNPDPPSATSVNDNSLSLVVALMDDGNQADPVAPTGYYTVKSTSTLGGVGNGE